MNYWTTFLSEMTNYLETIALPFGLTFIIAFLIGFERQNIGKAAGISSHVLIAVCSCAIAIMQQQVDGGQSGDGQRIIAQLVTGVGFLGAGVIMKSEKTVKGLTTATTVFACAIIGLILGSGFYAIGLTLGIFIIIFMYVRDIYRHLNPLNRINTGEEDLDE